MKKRLFFLYAFAALLALLTFEYAFWSNGFTYLERLSEKDYLTQAQLLGDLFETESPGGKEQIQDFAEKYGKKYNIRITVIAEDGTVAGESDGDEKALENHLNRTEVQQALQGKSTSVIRRSDTFQTDFCYCAVPVEIAGFQGVVRAAVPMQKLQNMGDEFIRSTLLAMLILILVAVGLFQYFRQYVSAMKRVETMRREFVSNVTHELKTPLTSIRGFVETLKDGAIHDEKYAIRFLDIIDLEAERLTNLIRDILILSEIENGQEPAEEPQNINELIREVTDLLEPSAKENVELIFVPDESVPPFVCNPDRIKQLLINLTDNGLKATEQGTVTISCRSREGKLILKIADTGIGMEQKETERIFERFYRVDKGRSKKQGGTGLGLSIVKHIVENYQGTIEVRSRLGEGTEFVVRLPYLRKTKGGGKHGERQESHSDH